MRRRRRLPLPSRCTTGSELFSTPLSPWGARAAAHAPPAETRGLLHQRSQRPALDDLDAGAPGIGDVGDRGAGRIRARRLVELDAFRLDLLHEGRMVLHVEAD